MIVKYDFMNIWFQFSVGGETNVHIDMNNFEKDWQNLCIICNKIPRISFVHEFMHNPTFLARLRYYEP